jgi:hypothetical protein
MVYRKSLLREAPGILLHSTRHTERTTDFTIRHNDTINVDAPILDGKTQAYAKEPRLWLFLKSADKSC